LGATSWKPELSIGGSGVHPEAGGWAAGDGWDGLSLAAGAMGMRLMDWQRAATFKGKE